MSEDLDQAKIGILAWQQSYSDKAALSIAYSTVEALIAYCDGLEKRIVELEKR